jgi:hypothetical protein
VTALASLTRIGIEGIPSIMSATSPVVFENVPLGHLVGVCDPSGQYRPAVQMVGAWLSEPTTQ